MTDDDGRVEIPLVLIDGNMDILLNKGGIPCTHISLMRDPFRPQAVILITHSTSEQQEIQKELGWQSRNMRAEEF